MKSLKYLLVCCTLHWSLFSGLAASSSTGGDTTMVTIRYRMMSSASSLFGVPQWRLGQGWEGVASSTSCAYRSRRTFPNSKGFLFNKESGRCQPLLWLEGQTSQGTTELQTGEGDVYVDKSLSCPGNFQVYESDSNGSLVCLRYSSQEVSYTVAHTACASWGGYLALTRTPSKLELLRSFANGSDCWVGFDDLEEEGTYVWREDQKTLTTEELQTLFASGEPNNMNGYQNCGKYLASGDGLDDGFCDQPCTFLCETDLVT